MDTNSMNQCARNFNRYVFPCIDERVFLAQS